MVSELSASGWRMKHPSSIEHFNFICDSFFIFIADLRYLSRKTIFWKKIGPLGGVISKFSEKRATKFWFIVPQEFYIANLEVRFLAKKTPQFSRNYDNNNYDNNSLRSNPHYENNVDRYSRHFSPKFRVMWFLPVENAYPSKNREIFRKILWKERKLSQKLVFDH